MTRSRVQEECQDRIFTPSLLVPALFAPAPAYAVQVGCFFTAVFLGVMFTVCIVLTSLFKHLLTKHVWGLPKTPWLRLFSLTWLEFLIGIIVFAGVRTNFWLTVLLYLPLAALANRALLAKFRQHASGEMRAVQRYGIFLLLPAALPVSLQISGVLWKSVTDVIIFTELR